MIECINFNWLVFRVLLDNAANWTRVYMFAQIHACNSKNEKERRNKDGNNSKYTFYIHTKRNTTRNVQSFFRFFVCLFAVHFRIAHVHVRILRSVGLIFTFIITSWLFQCCCMLVCLTNVVLPHTIAILLLSDTLIKFTRNAFKWKLLMILCFFFKSTFDQRFKVFWQEVEKKYIFFLN